ncbi:MAG: DMT family transporter [Verrucomicrobiales bacterium]|nr:DMT family transporter [Verrucomicrobiales bacterium]
MNPSSQPAWRSAWFLWTLLAVVCWGIWAILSKLLGDALSAEQSQALSTGGAIPVLIALSLSKRLTHQGNRWRGIGWALSAGVLTCLGNTAYYGLLRDGAKAATAVPLTAMYPLITLLLAVGFLRERLNRVQQMGILLSLGAIYLFNVPGEAGLISPALAAALAPIGLWGVAGLLQKMSTNEVSGELSALVFLSAFVPIGIYLIWQHPLTGASLTSRSWVLVTLVGLCFALGNFALLEAFARGGKASVIAPLAGLYPMISVPIAVLVLGEKISWRELGGITLALLAVAALSLESRRPALNLPNH